MAEMELNDMRSRPKGAAQIRNGDHHRHRNQHQPQQQHNLRAKKERIYGSVVEIKGNIVHFELNELLERFHAKTGIHPSNEVYFIRFMSDRTTITLEHRALEYMNNQGISRFFFPTIAASSRNGDPLTLNKVHPTSYTNQK